MKFLETVKNSIYNPKFYESLKEATLGSSFKYFFSLAGLLSLVIAFILGIQFSPVFSEQNLTKIAGYYPQELSIAIKGGVVSSNVTEPYFIKATGDLSKATGRENIVVIDTKNPFSLELFKEYKSEVWVGKNFIVITKRQFDYEIKDVSSAPDFSLDKARILGWVEKISSYHVLLSLGFFLFLFLAFLGFFAISLVPYLILTLLIMGWTALRKAKISYGNSYRVILHAATLPLILETCFIIFGLRMPFPFSISLLILLVAVMNLEKANEDNRT